MANINYKQLYDTHKQIIPLLILLILCVKIVITALVGTVELAGENYAFVLTPRHYAAFAAVLANFVIYFAARRIYIFTLIATLLSGIFGLISVTDIDTRTTYSFNSLTITVEPSCFYLLLFVLILNLGKIGRLFSGREREVSEKVVSHKQQKQEIEIEKFKKFYATKSSEQLQQLLDAKRMTPSAQEAAEMILRERQEKSTNNNLTRKQ